MQIANLEGLQKNKSSAQESGFYEPRKRLSWNFRDKVWININLKELYQGRGKGLVMLMSQGNPWYVLGIQAQVKTL